MAFVFKKRYTLHLTRYFPNYKLDISHTPINTITKARDIAMKYLDYVYTGNVIDIEGNNTFCPSCGYAVIKRNGYMIQKTVQDKKCPKCGGKISLVEI